MAERVNSTVVLDSHTVEGQKTYNVNIMENNKPMWQLLSDIADSLTDPVAKAEAKEQAEKMRLQEKQRTDELVGGYILAKVFDVVAVALLLLFIGIVIYLFTVSIFEGFVGFVVAFFFIKYIFKKRNQSMLSTFFGWF